MLFFLPPSLLPSGWFWLWPAHLAALCPVFPGRPAALLYGGLRHRSCHILEGENSISATRWLCQKIASLVWTMGNNLDLTLIHAHMSMLLGPWLISFLLLCITGLVLRVSGETSCFQQVSLTTLPGEHRGWWLVHAQQGSKETGQVWEDPVMEVDWGRRWRTL